MFVCCACCVLSGRGLCDGLITRPEESYRLWRVVVCDQEASNSRRLKPATGLWKIQPQWVVTPGKQTNKQTFLLCKNELFYCAVGCVNVGISAVYLYPQVMKQNPRCQSSFVCWKVPKAAVDLRRLLLETFVLEATTLMNVSGFSRTLCFGK
jgi:hypothetical protein